MYKATRITFVFFFLSITAITKINAKPSKLYFIPKGGDTTFCNELSFYFARNGEIRELEYTDVNGKAIKLKGIENIPVIETIHINAKTLDRIPFKPEKPDGEVNYTERVMDGKIKVYLAIPQQVHYTESYIGGAKPDKEVYVNHGPSIYTMKLPDGTYWRINNSTMKNAIKPFLMQCADFTKRYSGKYGIEYNQINEIVQLYNYVCN